MAELISKKDLKLEKNNSLFLRAQQVLVGGVNSPVRAFNYVGGQPIVIEKAKGAEVWDHDGNNYVDYVLSFGALILGHGYPYVQRAVEKAIKHGFHFGSTTLPEIELAEYIKDAIPSMEKIRFVNSGTEAVMGAIRLARGATGRNKIIKFKKAYHGHSDYLLVEGGSGLASQQLPLSKGVPKEFIEQTIVVDFGHKEAVQKTFDRYGEEIAAVIVEPVGGNYGVVPPDLSFLRYLREVTKEFGSLLISDEVITGFRLRFGAASNFLGIQPDLTCFGKIIGGGLPVGAYGGKTSVMNNLSPLGDVYQASTFAGNPIVMTAGKATLESLKAVQESYFLLGEKVEDLLMTIQESAKKHNVKLSVSSYESMFSIKFSEKKQFQQFYANMLKEGVFLAPSEYEANFISFAHTQKEIEKTKEAIWEAFELI